MGREPSFNLPQIKRMTKHELECFEEAFYEWHLKTYFVPFDPTLVVHMARLQGFKGGYMTWRRPIDAG